MINQEGWPGDQEAPWEPGNIHDQLLRSFLANWLTRLLRATRGATRATHKPGSQVGFLPRGVSTYTCGQISQKIGPAW